MKNHAKKKKNSLDHQTKAAPLENGRISIFLANATNCFEYQIRMNENTHTINAHDLFEIWWHSIKCNWWILLVLCSFSAFFLFFFFLWQHAHTLSLKLAIGIFAFYFVDSGSSDNSYTKKSNQFHFIFTFDINAIQFGMKNEKNNE